MSVTLSKGFKKPQTGDSGASFFPDLEHDIQQTNDHTHNGTDSQKLTVVASEAFLDDDTGTPWTLVGSEYRKTITLPSTLSTAGLTVDTVSYQIRDSVTGSPLYLETLNLSPTTFYVYSNDNTLQIDLVYTT